jgi:hypothetical protein
MSAACAPTRELRPVPDYPGHYADAEGVVWVAGADGVIRPAKLSRHPKGYLRLAVRRGGRRKRVYAHRLVNAAWNGPAPAPGMMTRHLDGDPANNRPENLRHGTAAENSQDRQQHKPFRGERNPKARLTAAQVETIRLAARLGVRNKALAAEFGVGSSAISDIVSGRNWRHLLPAAA